MQDDLFILDVIKCSIRSLIHNLEKDRIDTEGETGK